MLSWPAENKDKVIWCYTAHIVVPRQNRDIGPQVLREYGASYHTLPLMIGSNFVERLQSREQAGLRIT
jgi:hypothetical protein